MRRTFLVVGFVMMLAVAACSGEEGAAGLIGPVGPAGPTGPAGAAGPAGGGDGGTGVAAEYVGATTCAGCHSEIAEVFNKSGHPYKLNEVVDGQPPTYPFTEIVDTPEGYTWDDISYVIGGYGWKARFIDQEGFIITGDADATTQYNLVNEAIGLGGDWVPYHPGEEKPYDCGSCHTTGYQPEGNQDGLPGLIGTWSEPGIQCEECHGPGSNHAAAPYGVALKVDRTANACGDCHLRGAPEAINASGGFIRHHEQYEELFQSKHRAIDCVACHDPHEGVIQNRVEGNPTTRVDCEDCHFQNAQYQASETMRSIVDCVDCHMPRMVKSAVGDAAAFTGDIRTHMWAIDPLAVAQFTEDGSEAISQIGLDFACKSCHREGGTATVKTDDELKEEAIGYHDRP